MCLRRWMEPSARMREDEMDAAVGGSVESLALQRLLYSMEGVRVQRQKNCNRPTVKLHGKDNATAQVGSSTQSRSACSAALVRMPDS